MLNADQVFGEIYPKIIRHIRYAFHHVRDPGQKDDCMQESLGFCWRWTKDCCEMGKDPRTFPMALATFATKHVKSGRKLTGMRHMNDPLSPHSQERHGFQTLPIPDFRTMMGTEWEECLMDNTQTPPPDQVCFRIDFPAWLRSHSVRSREIIRTMMSGETTKGLSEQFGVTPGRISQMRRELMEDWRAFTGEVA